MERFIAEICVETVRQNQEVIVVCWVSPADFVQTLWLYLSRGLIMAIRKKAVTEPFSNIAASTNEGELSSSVMPSC